LLCPRPGRCAATDDNVTIDPARRLIMRRTASRPARDDTAEVRRHHVGEVRLRARAEQRVARDARVRDEHAEWAERVDLRETAPSRQHRRRRRRAAHVRCRQPPVIAATVSSAARSSDL